MVERENPPSLGSRAAAVATRIGSTAVLEVGPTEIFPLMAAYQGVLRVSVDEAAHPRPRYPAESPGFSRKLGGFRRETDCLLEGNGFELPIPREISSGFEASADDGVNRRVTASGAGSCSWRVLP